LVYLMRVANEQGQRSLLHRAAAPGQATAAVLCWNPTHGTSDIPKSGPSGRTSPGDARLLFRPTDDQNDAHFRALFAPICAAKLLDFLDKLGPLGADPVLGHASMTAAQHSNARFPFPCGAQVNRDRDEYR